MPPCHVKFFPSQIHFAHPDIVWVAFVMQLFILLNCMETNLVVLLAFSDITAAATTNQTKKIRQTTQNHGNTGI
jgi:hypothetical protein